MPWPRGEGDVSRRVLVVHGERRVAAACKAALRAFGFEPFSTGNAERALFALGNAPYRALVVDLHATGVDGLGIVSAVRAYPPMRSLPIVGLFPHIDDVVADLACNRGCSCVLLGPLHSDGLASALETALATV